MRIGIIDAEIIGKTKHRFPNLCSMKLSSYHKSIGDTTELLLSYDNLDQYDKVYISKVFTWTEVPEEVLSYENVEYGGTGFFYDKAPKLPCEIEHAMPDYHLYDNWVQQCIDNGAKETEFTYYRDYSIGYLTRGCFRGCHFCVNRNCKRAEAASPLSEFYDETRPKICFLDDNFLSFPGWKELIEPVKQTGKPFQFKQGLDERLLTKEKVHELASWRYDGEVIFAFDNIEDKKLIMSKLMLIRAEVPHWKKGLKFYVFCGCDKNDVYDEDFWRQDIENLFERIFILKTFGAIPYVMRFQKVYDSAYNSFYATVAAWVNQPSFLKKSTFKDFAKFRGMSKDGQKTYKHDTDAYLLNGGVKQSAWVAMEEIDTRYPELSERYFNFVGKPPTKYEWLDRLLMED